MLRVLLAKDLRRAGRNPLPWIINLIVPLAMTALLGLVFGGHADSGGLGRIRFAVVDEDQSMLTRFLRGAMNQGQAGDHLDPVFMERTNALKLVNENKISAVLILETNFTRDYLTARKPVCLHLIKNPAESIHPAVLEELLGAVATGLNALARNFNSEFPEWQAVLAGREDYHRVSVLIERAGDKLSTVKKFINPPLVGYTKELAEGSPTHEASAGTHSAVAGTAARKSSAKSTDTGFLFGYLLLGLSAMFLLFLGQNAMTDLHKELQLRTFARFQTLHAPIWPFILGKMVFAVVMLLICSAVLLGGGGLVFQIHWQHPAPLAALVLGYAVFVAALFAVLVALVPDERRAGVLNNVAAMALGLMGGCAFPVNQLPAFIRLYLAPLMPSHWFVEAARSLQGSGADVPWGPALLKLAACSLMLTVLAAGLFRRKFKHGLRA